MNPSHYRHTDHGPTTANHIEVGRRPSAGARIVLWAAACALIANSVRYLRQTHRQRLSVGPVTTPRLLQTWEGEGGRADAAEPEAASSTALASS
jgi:hypothetical protein